jgi:hypothetical protein
MPTAYRDLDSALALSVACCDKLDDLSLRRLTLPVPQLSQTVTLSQTLPQTPLQQAAGMPYSTLQFVNTPANTRTSLPVATTTEQSAAARCVTGTALSPTGTARVVHVALEDLAVVI